MTNKLEFVWLESLTAVSAVPFTSLKLPVQFVHANCVVDLIPPALVFDVINAHNAATSRVPMCCTCNSPDSKVDRFTKRQVIVVPIV